VPDAPAHPLCSAAAMQVHSRQDLLHAVMVSPSPQPEDKTEEKLHTLQKYTRDFRCQHTTDAEYVWNNSDDEDYNLGIGCLVVT
jgi:hypothetical protein